MELETIAVHGGYIPEPTAKTMTVPTYQTTSDGFDSAQQGADLFDLEVQGNTYARIMNPTVDVLEKRIAAMEGGGGALGVASGMGAIKYAPQTIAAVGDNSVSAATLHGGTYNLLAHAFPQRGIATRFADAGDPAAFANLIEGKTKAMFCESIGNPLGSVTGLKALADVAHAVA